MISKYLEIALNDAFNEAHERGHTYLTAEHLLLAIVRNDDGKEILEAVGGDLRKIGKNLNRYLDSLEKSPDKKTTPMQTIGFQRILQSAISHLQSAEKKELEIGDVLAAILNEEDSQARYILEKEGIQRVDILEYISHGHLPDSELFEDEGVPPRPTKERLQSAKDEKVLEKFTVNMCELAKNGEYDMLIGREKELERTIEVLARRNKNNPIHVGDPGVGKTAIAQGLAQLLASGDVPHVLQEYTLYSLEMSTLVAGTRFRGDFEERIKNIFNILEKQKAIVFIDEIHTIVGAGSVGGSSMDASNLLKPFLTRGKTRILGSTTFEEYRQHFEKDRALSRRFQKIDISESSVEDAIKILKGVRNRYEAFHRVQYSNSALEAMVKLSHQYVRDRYLPDKAVDVLDELGAWTSIHKPDKIMITVTDVEKQIARITKSPVGSTKATKEKDTLKNLEQNLNQNVFDQKKAVHSIVSAVQRHRAGLAHPEKPIGSFLFVGPTGVGKTELCRQLAHELSAELLRFDMSEYMEKHSISRLLGSPPGYVGFDQGAMLIDGIRKNPNAVLLLDEIEKAHPDIFNALLQIMDHATLTDTTGRKADFRNVVLIMTSNAGSREMSSYKIGFFGDGKETGDPMAEIKNFFSPEFRNRLDDIVVFDALSSATIEKVVQKFLKQLQEQLTAKKIQLTVTNKAVQFLSHKGYDPQFGARPMERLIQEEIKDPIVKEILFGELNSGGDVIVDAKISAKDQEKWQILIKTKNKWAEKKYSKKKPSLVQG